MWSDLRLLSVHVTDPQIFKPSVAGGKAREGVREEGRWTVEWMAVERKGRWMMEIPERRKSKRVRKG